MKIAFADALHFQSGRGMWRFYGQLLRHARLSGLQPEFMPAWLKSATSHPYQVLAHEMVEPLWFTGRRAQTVIYPFNVMPYLLPPGARVVVVICDLLFLNPKLTSFGARYRRLKIWRTIERAHSIITISDQVRQQLAKIVPSSKPLHLIPCQLGDAFASARPRERKAGRFRLFHLGGTSPSKATDLLLEALGQVLRSGGDCELVLGAMTKHVEWVEALRQRFQIPQERLVLLPRVSDTDLAKAYAQADLHVMPSRGEGFGMPIIEAASQGTPNLLAPLAVFREILGTRALYFDAWNAKAIADGIRLAMSSKLDHLAQDARTQARKYVFEELHREYAAPFFSNLLRGDNSAFRMMTSGNHTLAANS